MMTGRAFAIASIVLLSAASPAWTAQAHAADLVRVGSKNFTEQEIVGELVAQLLEQRTDLRVERKFGLGGTGLCHAAMMAGELDIYVEYTGTALLNVLHLPLNADHDEVFRIVSEAYRSQFGLEWLPPIGFNNTYAITVTDSRATAEGWREISDLKDGAAHLSAGFTHEFMERPDGYPGLQQVYGIRFGSVRDLEPGLMYDVVAGGQVDVICAFATDGRISAYSLRVLRDDRRLFPPYQAAPVVRSALLGAHPEIRAALADLSGTINDQTMRDLNYAVDVGGRRPAAVAVEWIRRYREDAGGAATAGASIRSGKRAGWWPMLMTRRLELWHKIVEHLVLTSIAVLIAVSLGVPVGILIHRYRASSAWVLAITEVVQTIPSLAMLAFLFAALKILGTTPAVAALVLYALLPIVMGTFTGLKEVPPETIEAANGMGMSGGQRLWLVELPLAMPVMIAGIRTATVWTVGIATLSTYIGAGGLGDFISRGLSRNDPQLTLLGAIPAAVIAVALSLLIRALERRLEKW